MRISELLESAPDYDLQGRYDEFNRLYFGGELPRIPVSFKPLKTVGGKVEFSVQGQKNDPRLIRLGAPKYKHASMVPGSMKLVISSAYLRVPADIDAILLHEMIHVWEAAVAKVFGENHAITFLNKRKELIAASGIDIPLTDSTKGLELVNAAVQAVGVILKPLSGGRHAYMMMTVAAVKRSLPDIQELYQGAIQVYSVDSKLWIEKSQSLPLQRSFTNQRKSLGPDGKVMVTKGYNYNLKWWYADDAAVADLKANGKLLLSKEAPVTESTARGRLYNASTVDHDPQGYLDPHVSDWVKEIGYGAGDWDESNIDEITSPMLYLGRDPTRWIRTIVGRRVGKHPNEVTLDDVRQYGRLNVIDDYDDEDVYHVHNDGKVSPLSGRDEPYYENLPVGPEPGDIISRDALPVSQSITGDELVRLLQRGLTETTYHVQFKRDGKVLAGDGWTGEATDERDARRKALESIKGQIATDKVKIAYVDVVRNDLTEAPISDVRHVGAWGDKDRNSSFYDPIDRRLVSHPAHVQRMKNAWAKTHQNFNMIFVNNPEGRKYQEVGLVDTQWLIDNMPKTWNDPMFKIDPDAINIVFTNNSGAERVPMTPWVLAHRFAHAIRREYGSNPHVGNRQQSGKTYTGSASLDFHQAAMEVEELVNEILGNYKAPTFKANGNRFGDVNLQMKYTIRRKFLQAIGTFKAAREDNLREYFEFDHEIFAQFLITGEIKFKPLPRSFRYGHTSFSWQGPDGDMEFYNNALEMTAESLMYRFNDALARSVGRIYVM